DRGRLERKLIAPAAPKPAAESRDVDDDIARRKAKSPCDEPLPDRRNLRRRPHLHDAVLEDRGAVLWLERGVREERVVICRLDDFRAGGNRRRRVRLRELLRLLRHLRAVLTRDSAFVPL